MASLSSSVWLLWFVLVALVLFLTPTGRPLSRRWGRIAATTALGMLAMVLTCFSPRASPVPLTEVTNPGGSSGSARPLDALDLGGAVATPSGSRRVASTGRSVPTRAR